MKHSHFAVRISLSKHIKPEYNTFKLPKESSLGDLKIHPLIMNEKDGMESVVEQYSHVSFHGFFIP